MHRITSLGYTALGLACIAIPLQAAEWTNTASVTPGVTYTDNVCLSKDNKNGQWIGTVTPAGTMKAEGARLKLNVAGSVEVNTLSDNDLDDEGCTGGSFNNREQFAPQLRGNANAVLMENWVYLDTDAVISQNQASPYVSGGGDSFDRTGNTNTTYNYSVSPYIQRQFKDVAELNLRYSWDEQYNTVNLVGDSTEQSAGMTFGSIPGASKYIWGLQGDYSKVDYSETPITGSSNRDSELQSAQLNLGYQFDRRWQVNGFFGNEWNDFVSTRDDIDGTFWDVGMRWTPNGRTTIDAGIGDRFFGNNPRFEINHSHKRSAFSAGYAKTLTYDRDIRTLPNSPPLNPDFPPAPGVDPGITDISESPILDERYTLGYTFQGLRSSFGVSAFQSQQTQEGANPQTGFTDSTFRGASVYGRRSLSGETSLTALVNWNEQDPKNSSDDNILNRVVDNSETWTYTLGLERQLSKRTTVGLNYEYTDRQSDNAFNTYTENLITLDLRVDL